MQFKLIGYNPCLGLETLGPTQLGELAMREYKETEIAGHEYVRCKGVQIISELGAPQRTILFHEESVAVIGSRHIAQPLGAVMNHLTADNGATEFDIIDFETMQPTGQKLTYQDAYAIMASLYLHTAHKRDFEEAEMVRMAEEQRIAEEQRQAEEAERLRQQEEAEQLAIAEQARQAEEAQKAAEEAAAAVAAAAESQRALEESQRLEAERLAAEEAARLQAEQEAYQAEAAARDAEAQAQREAEAAAPRAGAYDEGTGTDSAIAAP